jgi:hypothetical protein
MRAARLRRLVLEGVALGSVALGACVRRAPPPAPVPDTEWVTVIVSAQQAALEGRHAAADSILADFVARSDDAAERSEVTYWRAMLALDPANPDRDPGRALPLLDDYLADTLAPRHATEARVIRTLAHALDSARAAVLVARAAADSLRQAAPEAPRPSPREEELTKEVERLKEQLERTNAELELIRRRMTPPRRPEARPPG